MVGRTYAPGLEGRRAEDRPFLFGGLLHSEPPQGRIRTVARTGWTDDGQAFVLPSETLRGQVNGEEDRHKEEWPGGKPEQYLLVPRPAKDIFSRGGSLAEWSKTVGRWAIGNHLLFFAISAALAAPLLRLLGQESGGLHFFGDSGSGKTTCLEAACSAWGAAG